MTTPYVTGTVSVTAGSAIVTGAGTGWQTAGLVAGVFGLDSANGNPIPVLSVDSDTQITLAKPWRGTTASGQAYWITYDTTAGQQTVSLMQKVVDYIARLDKPFFSALASLVPAADKLPYFGAGGAGALADFPAAARALLAGGVLPNLQLPSRLRELPTIVTSLDTIAVTGWTCAIETTTGIPPGGQYWLVNTIAWPNGTDIVQIAYNFFGAGLSVMKRYRSGSSSTWSAWKSSGNSTLGTVSQIGGVATGAIIERGSNANGEYTRFADGTQICTLTKTINTALNSTYGNLYYTLLPNWNFPATFLSDDAVSVAATARVSPDIIWAATGNVLSTYTEMFLLCPVALSARDIKVRYSAIGRWF